MKSILRIWKILEDKELINSNHYQSLVKYYKSRIKSKKIKNYLNRKTKSLMDFSFMLVK